MTEIPTKWAIVEFDWGEGNKHIYSLERWEIGYYRTEEEAREAAKDLIWTGSAKKVAIMEVKALIVPKPVEFTETV